MINASQEGRIVTVTCPAGGKSSGDGVLVGSLFGVAVRDAAAAAALDIERLGVFELPKLTTDVITVGAPLYWDDTNSWVTLVAGALQMIGCAASAAGNGVLVVQVLLDGAVR